MNQTDEPLHGQSFAREPPLANQRGQKISRISRKIRASQGFSVQRSLIKRGYTSTPFLYHSPQENGVLSQNQVLTQRSIPHHYPSKLRGQRRLV